jgi:hypothetical protein
MAWRPEPVMTDDQENLSSRGPRRGGWSLPDEGAASATTEEETYLEHMNKRGVLLGRTAAAADQHLAETVSFLGQVA